MGIIIKLDGTLRKFTGTKNSVEVKGETVRQCLDDLVYHFPDLRKWLFDRNGIPMVLILVNEKIIHPENLNGPVKDSDEIHLFMIIGGG